MKFRVGDKVKVIDIHDYLDGEQDYSKSLLNQTGVIEGVEDNTYGIKFDKKFRCESATWYWHKKNLELIDREISDKEEVIDCLAYILKEYEREAGDNKFALPNGSIWTYEKMLDYIKKNLG